MNIAQARELLGAAYKNKHTLHAYAHSLHGFLKLRPLFSKQDQSVYLFPGTLHLDDTVVGFHPPSGSLGAYDLKDLVIIKPVRAFLNKQVDVDKNLEENEALMSRVQTYLEEIENPYYVRLIADYLQLMVRHEPVSEERLKITLAVFKELRKTNANTILDQLVQFVTDYYAVSKINLSIARRDKTIKLFVENNCVARDVYSTSVDELKENFIHNCEKMNFDKRILTEVIKSKVVAQVMLIGEVVDQKEMYTVAEIDAVLNKYRADICRLALPAVIYHNIKIGLDRLLAEEFVEKNQILNTYSLTPKCKAVMLQLMELENHWNTK